MTAWQVPEAQAVQVPPQPSLLPQELVGQSGMQTHCCKTQAPASQGVLQQLF